MWSFITVTILIYLVLLFLKANVWRKDIGEKKPFRYPYDLGKLVNFQQVGTYSKIDLKLFIFADYFIH